MPAIDRSLSLIAGGPVDEVELASVMKDIDEDGSGEIDEIEFLAWFKTSSLAHELRKQVILH